MTVSVTPPLKAAWAVAAAPRGGGQGDFSSAFSDVFDDLFGDFMGGRGVVAADGAPRAVGPAL